MAFRAGGLVVLVIMVYWPSFRAGFIWDDDTAITLNRLVQGGWAGLRDIWFSLKLHDWVPLTTTSFWLEWRLWGLGKSGYHATNIFLHALNVVLVWRVLLRLRIPGAWVAAMLFAVHPLCVTSVTWVAERKNTLSMFFYLVSLLWYLRSKECRVSGDEAEPQQRSARPLSLAPRASTYYWLSVGAFLLALTSKPSTVILPLVLLLCGWWQSRQVSREEVGRTIPFFLAALLSGLMTVFMHYFHAPVLGVLPVTDNLVVRALGGARAIWFYLGKAVFPHNLTMHYPRWVISPASLRSWLPVVLIVAAFAVFWYFRRTWGKGCLFGFGYFVIALLPTLGLLKMVFLTLSQVADHFQYLALPALIALVVAGACQVVHWRADGGGPLSPADGEKVNNPAIRLTSRLMGAFAAGTIILLSVLTWRHELMVGNAETLWRDNIKKNPGSWPAHNNLGSVYAEQSRYKEAEQECIAALTIDPGSPDACYNLGNALLAQNKFDQAIRAFTEAIRLLPSDSKAHNNLSNALFKKERVAEALEHVREAVRLDPNNAEARCNLGNLLARQGQSAEAMAEYREVLRLQPDNATAHNNLGQLLASSGKFDEALAHFGAAVRWKPDSAEAQANLANGLFQEGKFDQALLHYAAATRLQPEDPRTRAGLGNALVKLGRPAEAAPHYTLAHLFLARQLSGQGKTPEAIQEYLQALQLLPDFTEAHHEVGVLLFQQHQTAQALDHWRQALKSKPDWPEILNNVAWLLATSLDDRLRDGAEAVALAERACSLTKQPSISYLDTLAAAYAETGRYEEAVKTAQKAVGLAEQAGAKDKAGRLRRRMELYLAGRPYREEG